MKCPACSNELSPVTYERGSVHLCSGDGCGGIWLKQREIKKLDDPQDAIAPAIVAQQRETSCKAIDRQMQRSCPCCDDIIMRRHFYSVKKEAEVHECPGCGGMWLDVGELEKLRAEYPTVQDREAAAEKLLNGMFDPLRATHKSRGKEAKDRNV